MRVPGACYLMNAAFDFNVAGIEFVAATLAAAGMFFYLPATAVRQGFWAAINFLVLWLVLPNAASWIALAVFLGSGYVVAQALRVRPSRWLLASYLAVLVAAFMVLRQYPVFGWVEQIANLPSFWRLETCRTSATALFNTASGFWASATSSSARSTSWSTPRRARSSGSRFGRTSTTR